MAYFVHLPSGRPISGQTLALAVGAAMEIGLQEYLEAPNTPMRVEVTAPDSMQHSELLTVHEVQPGGARPNIQARAAAANVHPAVGHHAGRGPQSPPVNPLLNKMQAYHVVGHRPGQARLNAVAGDRRVVDSVRFDVSGQPTPFTELVNAINIGRVVLEQSGDRHVISAIARGSTHVVFAPEIIDLLLRLAVDGTVRVLSLLRRGQSQHGVVIGDQVFVRAVDISAYAGLRVTLGDRERAIQVVENIIGHFPPGDWDIGFPRPVGGATGFSARDDVFFPVPDENTAGRCFAGTISMPLNQMLTPARERIQAAVGRVNAGGVRFHNYYPDGLDHMHISFTTARLSRHSHHH